MELFFPIVVVFYFQIIDNNDTIPYIRYVLESIAGIVSDILLKIIYVYKKIIFEKLKSQTPLEQRRNTIYKIRCNDYGKVHLGQSKC